MVRRKHRYYLVEIIPRGSQKQFLSFSDQDVYNCIKDAVIYAHGDYGIACLQSTLQVKYLNPYTRIMLVRAKLGAHKLLLSALTFVTKLNDTDIIFRTMHTAGTIKLSQQCLIKHHEHQLNLILQMCTTEEERMAVQTSIAKSNQDMQDTVDHQKKEDAEESGSDSDVEMS